MRGCRLRDCGAPDWRRAWLPYMRRCRGC